MFNLEEYCYIKALIEQDIADTTKLNLSQLLPLPQRIKHKLEIIIKEIEEEWDL